MHDRDDTGNRNDDLFDGMIPCARWLAHVGDSLDELTQTLSHHSNSLRADTDVTTLSQKIHKLVA